MTAPAPPGIVMSEQRGNARPAPEEGVGETAGKAGVSRLKGWSARRMRMSNRLQARRSGRLGHSTRFVAQPEPRSIGRVSAGQRLLAGEFRFEGQRVNAPGISIWDVPAPTPEFAAALHGFGWLDDLAALGDGPSRTRAQAWLGDWITRHGRGRGAGWVPELAGRRLIRWVHHGVFLLTGQEESETEAFFTALARQCDFLAHRWKAAPPGRPRFEALTGLLYAGLWLRGMEAHAAPARAALGRECAARIDAGGGIASRNPEELMEVFTLLTWAAAALRERGGTPTKEHSAAIERVAPTLRSLRHSDGALARFHGGGRGAPGQLDRALAFSGVRAGARAAQAMGYARLAAGRTSVIVDAAPPPGGEASRGAHASTLALEVTSGRRPLIVSCGAGWAFGPHWRRAGRASGAHSTLSLEGVSSSRLGGAGRALGGTDERLAHRSAEVTVTRESAARGTGLLCSHDGYVPTHGLVHVRRLDLSRDGRTLSGEEALAALDDAQRRRFEAAMRKGPRGGIACALRFHLHPDVEARLEMGAKIVLLTLRSGELWQFRAEGAALELAPSVYLETERMAPRPTLQIVLPMVLGAAAGQISWTLAKARDTPIGVRDLVTDEDDQQGAV